MDLGIHLETCMTRLETCGAAGGAISLWVKVMECLGLCGIITSSQASSGTSIQLTSQSIMYDTLILRILLTDCIVFIFGGHKSFLVGPLTPLFWTSGDISSGFQSQSGQH